MVAMVVLVGGIGLVGNDWLVAVVVEDRIVRHVSV